MTCPRPPDSHQLLRFAPGLSPAPVKRRVDDRRNQSGLRSHLNHRKRQRKSHRRRALGTEDDRDLAADRSFVLPSDRPRLERQEAFRVSSAWRTSDVSGVSDDDHNLYQLGLLYNDEHLRGSGFNLGLIIHSEPVYSLRPAKRTRKQRGAQFEAEDPIPTPGSQSRSLCNGTAFVQLFASGIDELHALEYTALPYNRGNHALATQRNVPLDVIYESQESLLPSPPATPVATSVPGLVLDEDDFMLLEDEVSVVDEESDTQGVSSATGEPWVILGDGS